jgi:oligopeptidase B
MPTPPIARTCDAFIEHHGQRVDDPYAWLRADNWQEVMRDPSTLDPEIRAYLEAENAYTDATLADTKPLQETLFAEMKGRLKEDDSSVPMKDGPWAYFQRFQQGQQQPQFCRHRSDDPAKIEIMLDGNVEAEGKPYFRVSAMQHTDDHTLLAWAADVSGSEDYTIRVRDLATGKELPDRLEEATPSLTWASDGKHLFYTKRDANWRPYSVWRHLLGTSQTDDVCVYEEKDPGYFVGVGRTASGDYIAINAHDHETSEWYVIPADDPTAAARLIAARDSGVEYDLEHHGDRFVLRTNADGAEDYKLATAPVASPGRENWQDLIPHKAGRLVLGVQVNADHLTRLERVDGLPRIVVREWDGGAEHAIAMEEEAYSLGLGGSLEYETTTLRFVYSSMTTPSETYDYDLVTRERTLLKRQEVPSGHNPDDYITRRIMAPAADGELVPVTLVYRRDTALPAPTLLYGYGSYGISLPASFGIVRLSLVDRGFVWAQAHIRGGMEKGYRWYKQGKREHKTNTFDDFVAARDHLVAENIAKPGAIVAEGGSAGGLLVGAVANRAPEKFAGIVANVPFVDVLNTICDETLPLTPPEWPEWGNPLTDPAAFERIKSYSPYDNVTARDYPHILAIGGISDPRVTYWEPAKWVAKLRARKTDSNMLLLKTEMSAGHGGASGRFDALKEDAMQYAFVLKALNVRAV